MATGDYQQTLKLVSKMKEEFSKLQNDSNHLLRAILYQLLVFLNRYYLTTYQVQSDTHVHARGTPGLSQNTCDTILVKQMISNKKWL
ncbi:MAG: hypothetical protein C5B59_06170 [Bacteroidetes bacterium]|nr:MAG: hypothetical protein C5B59_06170 [Bacteroidota bacterium]